MAVKYITEDSTDKESIEYFKNPTLEQLLEKVSYSDKYYNYIPSKEAVEYSALINAIYNGEMENETPIMHFMMFDALHSGKDICLVAHRGSGKALDLETLVETTNGSIMVKDIKRGDSVINSKGGVSKVVAKSKIFEEESYEIEFTNGLKFKTCRDHNWEYWFSDPIGYINKKKYKKNLYFGYENKKYYNSSRQLYNNLYKDTNRTRPAIKVELKVVESFRTPRAIIPVSMFLSYIVNKNVIQSKDVSRLFIGSKELEGLTYITKRRDIFIPNVFKRGTVAERCAIVVAFFSKYGKAQNIIESVNKRLVDDLYFIVRSLGIDVHTVKKRKGSRKGYYFYLPSLDVFKDIALGYRFKAFSSIKKIRKIEPIKTQCLSVGGGSGSFMLDSFIPTANSTVMAQNLFFYIAIYGELPNIGRVKFAIYVSDTIKNGCKTMTSNMKYTYENSSFLQQMIPTAKFTQDLWELTNINGEMLSVRVYGAEGGIRGGREQNTRPNVAIIDDVLNDKNAVSETKLKDIKKVIFSAINYAMHPKNLKIIIGTPFHSKCVVSEAITNSTYYNVIFPIAEKFPCTKEEFRGSWDDRFGYYEVKKMYDQAIEGTGDLTIQGFYQEVMLSPSGKNRTVVKEDAFRKFSRNSLMLHQEDYQFYITTDFATTDKDSSDLSVILVWAYGDGGVFHLVDGYAGKSLMDTNIDLLFKFVSMYPIVEVGIEVNGQQGGFISWIKREMITRKVSFRFASSSSNGIFDNGFTPNSSVGVRSTGNKVQRFNYIQPTIARKQIMLAIEDTNEFYQVEFLEEFLQITPESVENAQYDDVIDATTQIQYLTVFDKSEQDYLNKCTVDFNVTFAHSDISTMVHEALMNRREINIENNTSYVV